MNPKNKDVKIYSKVSGITNDRLKQICVDHGFKSTYQVLQHLIYCFLRVMDKENDPIDLPIPIEIEQMFNDHEENDQYKTVSCFTDNLGIHAKQSKRKQITIEDF